MSRESKQAPANYRLAILPKWTHWDLNPGPSACEADVIPLHHEPSDSGFWNLVATRTAKNAVDYDTQPALLC